MQLPGSDLQELLEKYQANTASPEERRWLEQWYDQLEVGTNAAQPSLPQETVIGEEIYAGIAARLTAAGTTGETPGKSIHFIGWKRLARVAAVILLTAGALWTGKLVWRKQPVAGQWKPAVNKEPVPPQQAAITAVKQLVASSGNGGRKKVVLPDGSIAWLNARSVITYPDQFAGGRRIVKVQQGEVFFSVVRDTAHPFVVYTGSVATTVLGTSFTVKQSFARNTIEVQVKTGKVKVERANFHGAQATVARPLLPGDGLSFDTLANTYRLKQVPVKGIAAFTEGKLIYEDATLEEIAYDIGRKYNIRLEWGNDRLKRCHYRIGFDDIPLDECLRLLSILTNTSIEKLDSRRYRIKGGSCN